MSSNKNTKTFITGLTWILNKFHRRHDVQLFFAKITYSSRMRRLYHVFPIGFRCWNQYLFEQDIDWHGIVSSNKITNKFISAFSGVTWVLNKFYRIHDVQLLFFCENYMYKSYEKVIFRDIPLTSLQSCLFELPWKNLIFLLSVLWSELNSCVQTKRGSVCLKRKSSEDNYLPPGVVHRAHPQH